MKAFGLSIVIENIRGSWRYGKYWSQLMENDYGYIENTIGVDGDEVDCFIGSNMVSNKFFAIRQINTLTGDLDEYKIMLGFNSMDEAYQAYLANYQPGWKGFGSIREDYVNNFRNWYNRSLEEIYAKA